VSDTPNTEQPAPFVAPTSAVPSSQSMPNIADLVKGSKGRKEPRNPGGASASRNLIVGGIVGGLFLVGGGYFAGQAMASGPKTLAAAIQQASTGKLPCGTPSGTTGAAGLITRLCGSTAGGAPTGGAGGGFGGGGGFGRGISGTVTAMSSGSVTVEGHRFIHDRFQWQSHCAADHGGAHGFAAHGWWRRRAGGIAVQFVAGLLA
jgi:hypothetical protein